MINLLFPLLATNAVVVHGGFIQDSFKHQEARVAVDYRRYISPDDFLNGYYSLELSNRDVGAKANFCAGNYFSLCVGWGLVQHFPRINPALTVNTSLVLNGNDWLFTGFEVSKNFQRNWNVNVGTFIGVKW